MKRRLFNQVLGVAGLGLSHRTRAAAASGGGAVQAATIQLARNGWMPNNERLPVLLYRNAIPIEGEDPAAVFENRFESNGWPPQWRDSVYDFHHYHSTAHEVLGFGGGHARLMFGGENGHELEMHAGDVVVLPAGTGHCKLEASPDFLVVGPYPPNQHWDICRSAPSAEAVARMRQLPFPKSDPVSGTNGPLTRLWRGV
ncbi:MAG TPA: hypothetical protein VHZ07_19310 [Bryobacteraceae bacterium]|jgi:uncharacterized protein YjlB|nr:hypothetical protein [Bryobacteraceae bacterium]